MKLLLHHVENVHRNKYRLKHVYFLFISKLVKSILSASLLLFQPAHTKVENKNGKNTDR